MKRCINVTGLAILFFTLFTLAMVGYTPKQLYQWGEYVLVGARMPEDTHIYVTETGCSSAGRCPFEDGLAHNWYDTLTREIVVAPGQSLRLWAHEACHARQHETVRRELGIEPSADLHEWYRTGEALRYHMEVGMEPRPTDWRLSADTLLEDFAESCARFTVGVASTSTRDGYFNAD